MYQYSYQDFVGGDGTGQEIQTGGVLGDYGHSFQIQGDTFQFYPKYDHNKDLGGNLRGKEDVNEEEEDEKKERNTVNDDKNCEHKDSVVTAATLDLRMNSPVRGDYKRKLEEDDIRDTDAGDQGWKRRHFSSVGGTNGVSSSSLPHLTLDQLSPVSVSQYPPVSLPSSLSSASCFSVTPPQTPQEQFSFNFSPSTTMYNHSPLLPGSFSYGGETSNTKSQIRRILPKPPVGSHSNNNYPAQDSQKAYPQPQPTHPRLAPPFPFQQVSHQSQPPSLQPVYPAGPSSYPQLPQHTSYPYQTHPTSQYNNLPAKMSPSLSYLYEKSLGSVVRFRENGSTIQIFRCCVCELPTDSEDRLRTHLTSNHSDLSGDCHQDLKCTECGQVCPDSASLARHRLLHPSLLQGRSEEKCKGCNRRFSDPGLLANHEKECSLYRPYRCEYCGRGYIIAARLKHHRKICEANPSPSSVSCNLCSKTFEFEKDLVTHLPVHAYM